MVPQSNDEHGAGVQPTPLASREIPESMAISRATPIQADVELAQLSTTKSSDPFLVTFTQPHDPSNPLDWPSSKKWAATDVLSATGFVRIMVSTIMAPALGAISSELSMTPSESTMALSIYLLATAFGPLVLGPLSEVYGRRKVLHASNIWFLVWNVACGFANTKCVLIASRFMAGFGASAIYALAGGVMGDVWRPEQRGKSLAWYLLIPLLGSAVGPIIGGFMAARTTWRWMFWSTSMFQAVMILVSFPTFEETYAPLILKRRAQQLRKETEDGRYQTAFERLDQHVSAPAILARSLKRPLRMLLTHPIIQLTALLSAVSYGTLYIVLSTFSDLWISHYGESVEISGLHYIAIALGEVIGAQVLGPLLDYSWHRVKNRTAQLSQHDTLEPEPEARIPLMYPGVALLALSFFFYGWTAQYRLPWIVVDIAVFLVAFAGQMQGIPQQAYVIDAYAGQYTSSALAASQFLRSLTAFLFPLFGPQMYAALGYGWGNSLLGFVSLVVGIVGPTAVWRYGKGMRAKAKV